MARNGSGTMSITNSFSANTTAESAKVNANFSDVASEITNSLPRDGQAAMTGQFKASSGTAAAPSISFGSDTNTGFYRKASDTIGVVSGGSEVASIDSEGFKDSVGVLITAVPTGAMMMFGATTSPTGWVRCNALTIGSASSGATERANADTEDLFTFLWTNYSDTVCAVSSGRGASAAADWAANKTIALPDLRGRALFGLDTMGNSAAARLGDVITDETTNGASGGAETVMIARADLPNTSISCDVTDPGHQHFYTSNTTQTNRGDSTVNVMANPSSALLTQSAVTGISVAFELNGGVTQTALENMPPCFLTTFIIKL